MFQGHSLLIIQVDSQTAISQATEALEGSGLVVIPSFDLQVARSAHHHCSCPHHGTDSCACQMVVLLVYNKLDEPISLMAHSCGEETLFELVDSPQQPASPRLKEQIHSVLSRVRDTYMPPGMQAVAE
jgi:hypothetical protein